MRLTSRLEVKIVPVVCCVFLPEHCLALVGFWKKLTCSAEKSNGFKFEVVQRKWLPVPLAAFSSKPLVNHQRLETMHARTRPPYWAVFFQLERRASLIIFIVVSGWLYKRSREVLFFWVASVHSFVNLCRCFTQSKACQRNVLRMKGFDSAYLQWWCFFHRKGLVWLCHFLCYQKESISKQSKMPIFDFLSRAFQLSPKFSKKRNWIYVQQHHLNWFAGSVLSIAL